MVRRGPARGPSKSCKWCNLSYGWQNRVIRAGRRPERRAGLLMIRRSGVRTSPAPPAVLIPVAGQPWTGLYTDVGEAMFEPPGCIWSHRVAVERAWRTEGVRREGPDWLLAWLAKSMPDWTTGVAASWLACMTRRRWSDLGFREVAEDTSSMCIGKGLILPGPPQQERPPDLGSLRAARGQILAAASQRGCDDGMHIVQFWTECPQRSSLRGDARIRQVHPRWPHSSAGRLNGTRVRRCGEA